MTKKEFRELISDKILFLDGATGTELQKSGMPKGVSPENWIIENEEILIDLKKIYQCWFGYPTGRINGR